MIGFKKVRWFAIKMIAGTRLEAPACNLLRDCLIGSFNNAYLTYLPLMTCSYVSMLKPRELIGNPHLDASELIIDMPAGQEDIMEVVVNSSRSTFAIWYMLSTQAASSCSPCQTGGKFSSMFTNLSASSVLLLAK